jgi:hypothetical protein
MSFSLYGSLSLYPMTNSMYCSAMGEMLRAEKLSGWIGIVPNLRSLSYLNPTSHQPRPAHRQPLPHRRPHPLLPAGQRPGASPSRPAAPRQPASQRAADLVPTRCRPSSGSAFPRCAPYLLVSGGPAEVCVASRSSPAARRRPVPLHARFRQADGALVASRSSAAAPRRTGGALRRFMLCGGSPAAEPCAASRSSTAARQSPSVRRIELAGYGPVEPSVRRSPLLSNGPAKPSGVAPPLDGRCSPEAM